MPVAFLEPHGRPDREAYAWVRDRPPGAVLELPTGELADDLLPYQYEYQTFFHGHPIVNGASGYFGSAGVLLALAMGAALVVAAGRDRAVLEAVAKAGGSRVRIVSLSGDLAADTQALRAASGGAASFALDIVGRAQSAASTAATLGALRRGGRLVLMGSVTQPLSVSVGAMLANDWSIIGNFMYPKDAPVRLARMISSGILDLDAVRLQRFPLDQLPAAMDAAARMRALDLTVVAMP